MKVNNYMSAILIQTNNKFEEFLIENNFTNDNAANEQRAQKIKKSKESN